MWRARVRAHSYRSVSFMPSTPFRGPPSIVAPGSTVGQGPTSSWSLAKCLGFGDACRRTRLPAHPSRLLAAGRHPPSGDLGARAEVEAEADALEVSLRRALVDAEAL